MIYFFDVFNNFMIKIENDNRTRFLTKFEVSSNDIYRLCNFLAYIQKPRVSLSLYLKKLVIFGRIYLKVHLLVLALISFI